MLFESNEDAKSALRKNIREEIGDDVTNFKIIFGSVKGKIAHTETGQTYLFQLHKNPNINSSKTMYIFTDYGKSDDKFQIPDEWGFDESVLNFSDE